MLVPSIRSARRRWWAGVGVSSLICIVGLAAIHALPDRFESTARLDVDLDAILMTNLDRLDSGEAPLTRAEILRSALLYQPNLERLLGGCPLMIPDLCLPRDSQQKMAQFMACLTVSQKTKSLFLILYRHSDPVEARDVLRALLKIFIETTDGSDFHRQDKENARRVLELRLRSFEQQVRAAEKRRADFLARPRNIFGDDQNPSDVDSLPHRIASLDGRLRDALLQRDTERRACWTTPRRCLVRAPTALSRPGPIPITPG